jgi:hypothetical protein
LILAVAAFLRLYRIDGPSLWMDEIGSIEVSAGRGLAHNHLPAGVIQTGQVPLAQLGGALPWWKIWTNVSDDVFPPVYYILLRWWMDVLGSSAAAVRCLSALASVGSIILLFDVCRLLRGPRMALLAAAVMALSPAQINFSQDARPYALLILLGLACCDAVVRIEISGASWRRCGALSFLLAAMALTHYLSLGGLAALAVYAAVRLRGSARGRTLGAFAVAAVFVAVVWGATALRQFHRILPGQPAFLFASGSHHVKATLLHVIGLPAALILDSSQAAALPVAALVLLAVLVLVVPLLRLASRRDLLLWVLWLGGVIGMLAASDLIRGTVFLAYIRYAILASPAVCALIASVDWPPRPLLGDAIAWCLLAFLAVSVAQRLYDPVVSKEDWRQLASDLNAQAGPNELLVFYGADPWISPGTWFMCTSYYLPATQRPWLILHGPANAALLRQLDARNSLWLVGKYPEEDGPQLLSGWEPQSVLRNPTAGAICRMVRVGPAHP